MRGRRWIATNGDRVWKAIQASQQVRVQVHAGQSEHRATELAAAAKQLQHTVRSATSTADEKLLLAGELQRLAQQLDGASAPQWSQAQEACQPVVQWLSQRFELPSLRGFDADHEGTPAARASLQLAMLESLRLRTPAEADPIHAGIAAQLAAAEQILKTEESLERAGDAAARHTRALVLWNLAMGHVRALERAGEGDEAAALHLEDPQPLLEEAVALLRTLHGGVRHLEVAMCAAAYADVLLRAEGSDEEKRLRRALRLLEDLVHYLEGEKGTERLRASLLAALGRLYLRLEEPAQAATWLEQSVRLGSAHFGRSDELCLRATAALAEARMMSGQLEAAAEAVRVAVDGFRALCGHAPTVGRLRTLAEVLQDQGVILSSLGRAEEAEASLREAIRVVSDLPRKGPFHSDRLAGLQATLGFSLYFREKWDEAWETLVAALPVVRRRVRSGRGEDGAESTPREMRRAQVLMYARIQMVLSAILDRKAEGEAARRLAGRALAAIDQSNLFDRDDLDVLPFLQRVAFSLMPSTPVDSSPGASLELAAPESPSSVSSSSHLKDLETSSSSSALLTLESDSSLYKLDEIAQRMSHIMEVHQLDPSLVFQQD